MSSILDRLQLTADQAAAAAATDPALVVTAGAGSGKTRTLAARFVGLLAAGAPLRSLVAITFTDKAAREMRTRIRRQVSDWLAACPEADRPRWQEILAGLEAARIGTIHSFCAALLRAHPAEANVDPGFAVLEENVAALLQARALEAALAWAANDPAASALFGPLTEHRLRETLRTLLDKRLDATAALDAHGDDPLAVWSEALRGWLDAALDAPAWREPLAALADLQARRDDDRLELARREVLARWDEVQAARRAADWDSALAGLAALRRAIVAGGLKAHWDAAALADAREAMTALRDYFDERLAPLADPQKPLRWALDRQAASLLPLLRAAFERALAEYARAKDERAALDFDDLEALAADLLAHNPAVRARWQQEIQAACPDAAVRGGVLVDEFQDTNARQRQIVYALAGFDGRGKAFQGTGFSTKSSAPAENLAGSRSVSGMPRPYLFVVGDAKQSIYRFRGADVAVFRQVQADVVAAGGRQIDLDLTFRAHAPLVQALNALLAPVLGAEQDAGRPYQVPFAPLRAFREAPRPGFSAPFVEFHLGLGETADEGRQAAAQALARRLHELRDREGLAWGDVALLLRASTGFPPYEDALERAGIPFVTVAGRGFYERPEVRDLLNALAALADPGDDLALAGLLRSPAVGLSDAALYRLRFDADGQRRGLWAALQDAPRELDPADAEQAAFAHNLVTDLATLTGRAPVGQILKQLLDATGYRAALALAGGERLLRNVDKLLDDAHKSGLVGVAEFLEYVQTLRDVGARESEAPTEAEGAVQLMTVHKAKGLEFPLVVIADAARSVRSASPPVAVEADCGILLDQRDGEARAVTHQLAALRQAEREEAESRRLLYVAATRAQEKLLVSGHAKISTAKADPGRLVLDGWLRWLGEVVGLDAVRLDGPPLAAYKLALNWPAAPLLCACHPLRPDLAPAGPRSPQSASSGGDDGGLWSTASGEGVAPMYQSTNLLVPPTPFATEDERTQDRESDPPPRVWRVVPRAQDPAGPAWVVGALVHAALRRWRFPDAPDFEPFLYPYALEAGLTDPTEILNAIGSARRLLARFRFHPLWAEMDAAERHPELPYSLEGERGIVDLLYRAGAGWTVAEFKTDRLADAEAMQRQIEAEGYDQQVARYVLAIERLLGQRPRALLVFLNVGRSIQVLDLSDRFGREEA